jgi:hypothetical protein
MSIKPVNSDTRGVPLRESIDNLASLRLRLADALAMEPLVNAAALSDDVLCLSVYRLK